MATDTAERTAVRTLTHPILSITAQQLGHIWQPGMGLCGTSRTWTAPSYADNSPYTVEQAILDAQTTQAGDFSHVKDVNVVAHLACGTCWPCVHKPEQKFCYGPTTRLIKAWDSEETEFAYQDTLGEY